jgi:pimeloyl-ACP methyl ester carboxylesterase
MLCRGLADARFASLRFDYHGVGDSTGTVARFRHDEPSVGDVEACLGWLTEHGFTRFVLVGECFGARTALATRDDRIEAIVLLSVPVRDAEKVRGVTRPLVRHRSMVGYVTRAMSPRMLKLLVKKRHRYLNAVRGVLHAPAALRTDAEIDPPWVSAAVVGDFREMIGRGTRILLVDGTGDPGFDDLSRARVGTLGAILDGSNGLVESRTLDGRIRAWAEEAMQAPTFDLIVSWLSTTISASERERATT